MDIKKILKDNKYTVIGLGIFACIAIMGVVAYNFVFAGSGNPLYGNRLEGIAEVAITNEQKDKVKENLLKESIVESVDEVNIKGKIINIIVTVKEKTKLDDAKKLTDIIVKEITEEQKKFFDIQVFIDINEESIDGYPTIGYLSKNSKTFKYTSATYEKEEDNN